MTPQRNEAPVEPTAPMSFGQHIGFVLLFIWALLTAGLFCVVGLFLAITAVLDEGPLIGVLMGGAIALVCLSGYRLAAQTLAVPKWRRMRNFQKIERLSSHYVVHHAAVLIVFSVKLELFLVALFPAIVGFILSAVTSAMTKLHFPAAAFPTARVIRTGQP